MSKRPRKPKVVETNEFCCCQEIFQKEAFIQHLETVHGFVRGTQCVRMLSTAVDGEGFYSNTYQWEIPCGDQRVKTTQCVSGPR